MRRIWTLAAMAASLSGAAAMTACSSSNPTGTANPTDAGATDATTGTNTDGGPTGQPTTIAAARAGNVTSLITVKAVVTAVRGDDPADTKEWYVEDPAGGPNSGVSVYCNKTAKKNPCPASVLAPALHDAVTITGTLSTYKGKVELAPTSLTVTQPGATPPPVATVKLAEIAPSATSQYRGSFVTLSGTFTVDDVTPTPLYDSKCADAGAPQPPTLIDAGAKDAATDGSADGGTNNGGDAGTAPQPGEPFCSGCKPPTYGGFDVSDGAGHTFFVENTFYTSEHLASSPECLAAAGAVAVTKGTVFKSISGILDMDPTAGVQALSPVTDSDYQKQ